MWIVRFLNGPMAGQIVPLTKHSTLIGRSPSCDIKVASNNVSKEHTRIEIFDDKLIISDAGSRNGTFLNGVQIRSSKAKSGDKIAVHDVYFEVQKVPASWAARYQQQQMFGGAVGYGAPPPRSSRRRSRSHDHEEDSSSRSDDGAQSVIAAELLAGRFPKMTAFLTEYMDRVVLPGLYRVPEMFEFRWVLAGFMAVFILLVTTLSTIPLVRILRSSIQEESQHHAMTIATTLARVNRPFLVDNGQLSGASVEIATARPGVKKAYIISNMDGNIVAPAASAGSYPDIDFVHEARKGTREAVRQIDDSTIVAMYPITVYNPEAGQTISHWAVVLYDMQSLAVDNGQVLSLFITTLFFALLLGFALFYILYKIIEHPIRDINRQLDVALKEGGETVSVKYLFPALQLLTSNVSSALTRALNGAEDAGRGRAMEHDRNREIANLVQLMAFAAFGIHAHDVTIAAVNDPLEKRLNMTAIDLVGRSVNELPDQSFKLSVKDLIERVDRDPDNLASNDLEFGGQEFQVVAQAVYGTSKIAYYLVVLLPKGEGG
jgi:hypothetical protein